MQGVLLCRSEESCHLLLVPDVHFLPLDFGRLDRDEQPEVDGCSSAFISTYRAWRWTTKEKIKTIYLEYTIDVLLDHRSRRLLIGTHRFTEKAISSD